jgi:hypothetical protein
MKRSIIIGFASLSLIALIISSCVKEKPDAPPVTTIPFDPDKVLTIAEIKEIYSDSGGVYTFTDVYSVYVTVVMDEKSGNIYKSSYVQDATGAIQLNCLNTSGLYLGDSVRLLLQGATIDNYHDLFQLQNINTGESVYKVKTNNFIEPEVVTIGELSGNIDYYQSRAIKLEGVQFVEAELGNTYADAVNLIDLNRTLEDCNGNSIIARTSGYASFAGDIIPEGNGSIVAIASVYNGTPQLVLRGVDEILLTEDRCGGGTGGEPIDPVAEVNEVFNGVNDYEDVNIEGWSNIIVDGTRKWQGKSFSSNKYAQSTGYNSGLASMETWLITPPVINTNGDKKLNFKSAMAYWEHNGEPFTVLASTNFDGSNFDVATWTELSATLPDAGSGNYTWVESGEVSLANFVGNVAVAFKYVGSDTESTSITLDDVTINTEGGGGGGGGTIDPVAEVNEAFDSVVDYEDVDIIGWTNVMFDGTRKWQGKSFDANKYVQATAYNSGLASMETWLITPPVINTSGDKVLTFKSAMAYWEHNGEPLTVLASTDFDGTNVETATWTPLSPTLANSGSGNYTFVESGEVDLSGFAGNVAIAFKYIGSDTESTSIQIDDVSIVSGK